MKLLSMLSEEGRDVRRLGREAEKVMALNERMAALSEEELKGMTEKFRERLKAGESLNDIRTEAFAVAREAAWRVLNEKPYKVQIMGSLVLDQGDIAELKTGEGKTLTATMAVYLNALSGKGVHVITVNEYLASRDASWMGEVYRYLGLSVGINKRELSPAEKRAVYSCDITYTTNAELGFDYLRDNMVQDASERVMRGLTTAFIDECDSVLVDEARTPLIISGGKKQTANLYVQADSFVKMLEAPVYETDKSGEKKLISGDYDLDEKTRQVMLTDTGVLKAEEFFSVENLYNLEHTQLVHHLNQALKANCVMQKEVEYVIGGEDEIIIVDQFTGRTMPGRTFSDGLHQALEAKEGLPVKEETSTLATITYQNFFRLYEKLAGMTGTAKTEEEEFLNTYNMRVIVIPTNRPVQRKDLDDAVFATSDDKWKAIVRKVKEIHATGQPVLVGTAAVETSELLSDMLDAEGIEHETLNAKNHAREAEIVAKAGQVDAVTIATNMAGRGTDIKLSQASRVLGGLAVIGTERHESRRIDNQLRGRSGRQGDPGFSQFYVSLEDQLMIRFGPERMEKMKKTLTGLNGEPITARAVTKSITLAQIRVEGSNFDVRKNLLDYDDVLRRQREIVYARRNQILESEDVREEIRPAVKKTAELMLAASTGKSKKPDLEELALTMRNMGLTEEQCEKVRSWKGQKTDELEQMVFEMIWKDCENESAPVREQILRLEKSVVLRSIDRNWIDHIEKMNKLRSGISLRSYAQNNPLQQYISEGFQMFEEMNRRIDWETSYFMAGLRVDLSPMAVGM